MTIDESDYSSILHNTTSSHPDVDLTDDKSHEVLVLHIVLACVTLLFTLARNYSRFFFLRSPGWDDCLLNIAWITYALYEVLVCLQTQHGLGKHIGAVTLPDRTHMLKLTFTSQILYFLSSFLVKSALATFYFRIAIQPIYKRACVLLMGLNISVFIGCLFGAIFLCKPVAFFWDRTLGGGEGRCGNIEHFFVANAALNMVCDIFTLVLPMPIVWSSPTIPKPLKARICALFLVGGVTCVASGLRIKSMREVSQFSGDVTWLAPSAYKWTSVEMTCAIIAACMPAIKPLICALIGNMTPIEVECARRRKRPVSFQEGTQVSTTMACAMGSEKVGQGAPYAGMGCTMVGGYGMGMTTTVRGGMYLPPGMEQGGLQKAWFPPGSAASDVEVGPLGAAKTVGGVRREGEEGYDSCYRPQSGWAK